MFECHRTENSASVKERLWGEQHKGANSQSKINCDRTQRSVLCRVQRCQLCLFQMGKCWEAWDTTCRHKAKDITPGGERRGKRKRWMIFLKRTREGHRQWDKTLEPFQRQCWGNFWETGWSTYGLFRAHRYHPERNWTEPNQTGISLHCEDLTGTDVIKLHEEEHLSGAGHTN